MSTESRRRSTRLAWLAALCMAFPGVGMTQEAVDTSSEIPLLSSTELETLVGSIALYPDDLLAIVLPASTYPLQLVQAERFLQDIKSDATLEPDESWDDSIIALINYPEVVTLLTKDLDKTWRLGEAVVAQQADVIAAIEQFRDRAYAAGNLKSDTHQTVSENEGVIEITPVEEDVIYVPYYEPERVVVYQAAPAYYYYPRAYPVYYYPYPYGHSFSRGFFWGVTTAFAVGWFSDSLHVYHHSYHGHPYYGHYYGHNYWYRQPSVHVHNNYYYNGHRKYYSGDRYRHGDYWQSHGGSTVNHHDQRVTRNRHYPGRNGDGHGGGSGGGQSEESHSRSRQHVVGNRQDIKFRQRSDTTSNQRSSIRAQQPEATRSRTASRSKSAIQFRDRPTNNVTQLAQRSSKPPAVRQPAKIRETSRSSQPARVSQPKRTSSQSARVSQPKRSSSQSARVSQPARASKPQRAQSSKSGSNKVANASTGRRSSGSPRKR